MRIVLLSTYDLGHQPLGLAAPAALLKARGHTVTCVDLSLDPLPPALIKEADLVAFYLPMHTATRAAVPWIRHVRELKPKVRMAAYGIYANLNAEFLRTLGLLWVAKPPLNRDSGPVPDRSGLKPLSRYAKLRAGGGARLAGFTESSRGCKHRCRHCPVVPVFNGTFRITAVETVLADVRQQAQQGARHITFGDPDFFNGPAHARRVVEAFHREFPGLTYDVTVKIEHLLKHRQYLDTLRETGCLFVTSAVESFDNAVLRKLEKGHTREDFVTVAGLMREHGLTLAPTFIAFTPWTSIESYRDFLQTIHKMDLVENTASVQLALRLLVTNNSRLLELPEIVQSVRGFDPPSLLWRWEHRDSRMDELAARLLTLIATEQKKGCSRSEIFQRVWQEVYEQPLDLLPRSAVPYLDEPWYC